MKKWIKRIIIILSVLVVVLFGALQLFIYKVKNGVAKPQTEKHDINIPDDQPSILLFSKTTGFRHSEAITASKLALPLMIKRNGWFVYETEDAGIFNEEELNQFEIVIWNNSTGTCLTDDQRVLFEKYIKKGGTYVGIHGSGDASHDWDWYLEDVIGAKFSHHPIKNHIQTADVVLQPGVDSTLAHGLTPTWTHSDEWYIFLDQPTKKGFKTLYQIDGTSIDPNGNMALLLMTGKDFGMGKIHPVSWYKEVGSGKVFYTSMGHEGASFSDENYIKMIENAIKWGLE